MMHDQYGPEKIIEVYNPKVGMRGIVVIDNTALGPGKGGIRMTATVSKDEVFRLARTMTWKNSLANIPFGGAKSGIICNPKTMSKEQKKTIVEAFGKALKNICPKEYIAAPDINMAEQEMRWFVKGNGNKKSVTGKPKQMGGLPHELGSTGFGVCQATLVAVKHMGRKIKNMAVVIEGFGNVGSFAAKHLSDAGATIVAVSDSKGVVYDKKGLNVEQLIKVKQETGSVINYNHGKSGSRDTILQVKADILITAAIPDLIKPHDVNCLKFKLIVEGSNIPMTFDVEREVYRKGILVIPDFVANSGGVISSYVEYIGGSEKEMFKMVKNKISVNTKKVLDRAKKDKKMPRESGLKIAKERVSAVCKTCLNV